MRDADIELAFRSWYTRSKMVELKNISPDIVKAIFAEGYSWCHNVEASDRQCAEIAKRPVGGSAMEPGEMSAGFARRLRDPWG